MPRSAAAIQAEITNLEGQLASLAAAQEYTIDGRTKRNQSYADITKRLDALYVQLDRATGADPLFVRAQVTGTGRVT